MGWSYYCHRVESAKEEMDKLHTWSSDGVTRKVLKSAMVGSTYYAAVEAIFPDGRRQVFASVCLTKRSRNDFGYKGMDESMGPNEARCPLAILNLLTETDSEHANDWRQRCRKYHAYKAARPAYRTGMVVVYGDYSYKLDTPAGPRRGWNVTRTSDGMLFRIRAGQLAKSTIVA